MKLSAPLDARRHELRNVVTERLPTPPSTPLKGQRYFDTGLNRERVWDGAAWVDNGPGPAGPTGPAGPPGPSITVKGTVPSTGALPPTGNTVGDGWITDDSGHLWLWNGTAWYDGGQYRGPQGPPGAPGGGTIEAEWRWITSPTTPPVATGRAGINTSSAATATELYVARVADNPNADYSAAMNALVTGDHIWIQERTNSERFIRFALTGAPSIDATTATFPVTLDSGSPQGGLPTGTVIALIAFQYEPAQGLPGPTGPKGDPGPAGPEGPAGPAGSDATVTGTPDRVTVTGGQVDIAGNYIGQTSLATVGTVTTGTWDAGPVTSSAIVQAALSTTAGGFRQGAAGPQWLAGTGTPEGTVTAPVGSIYSRTDGTANTSLYRKESGTGNTGWVAVSAAGASSVSSVDGRTGAVTLSDLYVDVTGDTMTGTLVAPSIGIGVAPVFNGLRVAPTANGTNSSHTAVFIQPDLTGTWSDSTGISWEPKGAGTSYVTGIHLKAPQNSVYVNTGLEIDPCNQGTGANYGAKIGAASTNTLWLSHDRNSEDVPGGIVFGSNRDTNLYRAGIGLLHTDTDLRARRLGVGSVYDGVGINIMGTIGGPTAAYVIGLNVAHRALSSMNPTYGIVSAIETDPGTAAGTVIGIQINKPVLASGASVNVAYGLNVGAINNATTGYGVAVGEATTGTLWVSSSSQPTTAAGGIYFGSARDTNLYRSGTDTLRTDSAFAADSVATGLIPALSGAIRLSNNSAVVWRNAANTADISGISVNSNNDTLIQAGVGRIIAIGTQGDTTSQTYIGISASQKIGFYGAAPVARQTGWAAATGVAARTTYATSTATLTQVAERLKALIDDLIRVGLIGA